MTFLGFAVANAARLYAGIDTVASGGPCGDGLIVNSKDRRADS